MSVMVKGLAWEAATGGFARLGPEAQALPARCRFCSSVHLLQSPPVAILVDDLSEIIYGSSPLSPAPQQLVKALAALVEAAHHIGLQGGERCRLIVTDTGTAEGPRNLFMYQRWLPLVLTIRPDPNQQGSNLLAIHPLVRKQKATAAELDISLQFTLSQSTLQLQAILPAPLA